MFRDSLGNDVKREQVIFPLVSASEDGRVWTCVGTGFYISPNGGFITAKHVFYRNDGTARQTIYGVHTYNNGTIALRAAKHFVAHNNADLAIGMLTDFRTRGGVLMRKDTCVSVSLRRQEPVIGEVITTHAFPKTEVTQTGETEFTMQFQIQESSGKVIGYQEHGNPFLKNRHYETNLLILDGASGGPVFDSQMKVIGVNSTGMELSDDEEPYSRITPIAFILELGVPEGGRMVPITELIHNGSLTML